MALLKHMDDFLASENVWIGSGYKMISENKCEDFFKKVKDGAAKIGMSVNDKKQLLCVVASNESKVHSYIQLRNRTRIESQDTLKQLGGFVFSTKLGVGAHIEQTAKKFRKHLWFLRHLKKAMVSQEDLIRIYKTFLLPIVDYASVAYHSLLTKDQSSELEYLQAAALR